MGFTDAANPSLLIVPDQVGSSRVTVGLLGGTGSTGSNALITNTDFFPFGAYVNPPGTNLDQQFTGKERDTESGLDYFGARYYASSMGRWMSPDWSAHADPVPYGKMGDPQSLNLYGYVRNNPLSIVDGDGHGCSDAPALCRSIRDEVSKGGSIGDGTESYKAAQQQINTNPPPLPPPPPSAVLTTSIKGGSTEFMWTDKSGGFHDDKISSLVKVDRRSKAGAGGPFTSDVVGQIHGLSSPAYGPEGAQINTGDSRGRWVHGGGSSLADPYAPIQKLTPTYGCTRACNNDVQRMAGEITSFQKANPGTPIPYSRTEQ